MSLITIFTAPKPFTNSHITLIQRNALQSWMHLTDVEVIMIGDETGMAEVAGEYGIKHLPAVAVNEKGTPLVSSIFDLARQNSTSPLLCYVNADILFTQEIVDRARQTLTQREKFLLVGQRWDLDVTEPLDFSEGWESRLQIRAYADGELHPAGGSDYFIFPRELYTDMPDFAIGRAGWDNWMIYHAVQQPWPAIDASQSVFIVHQNHDYHHLGGKPHYKQEETFTNAALGGGMQNMYMLLDCNQELIGDQVRSPRLTLARLVRILERWIYPEDRERQKYRWALALRLHRLRKKVGG